MKIDIKGKIAKEIKKIKTRKHRNINETTLKQELNAEIKEKVN